MMRKYIVPLWLVSLSLGPTAIAGGQKSTTLDAVRAYVVSYYQDLPDYTCVQETTRELTQDLHIPGRVPSTSLIDQSVIEEELSLVGGKETYKVTRVNGFPAANTTHEQIGGTVSTGEYGSLLRHIFDPETGTSFQSVAPAKLQGRTMNVFTFSVPQAKGYPIYDGELKREFLLPYKGSVYADAETSAVMRITIKCVDFPSEARLTAVELTLDYKPTQLSDRKFALPSQFKLVWRKAKNDRTGKSAEEETNTGNFKLYHRFKTDSTIDFKDKD